MSSVAEPKAPPTNRIGLTVKDYGGLKSTLCVGCGHDVITRQITQAFYDMGVAPYKTAKMSGIGCSSKTTAYFADRGHGFNAVHGRMPAIATGANAANKDLVYIGISGDGDSLSIGLGQFCHAIRRNVNLLYVIENNGVYGLTKGQFSASADIGSKSKGGETNVQPPIDPVLLALTLGATFVARSFSGDKTQLVPILKAGLRHRGFGLIDIISPCVTFNDHEASTKSYRFTREHHAEMTAVDFVPVRREITSDSEIEGRGGAVSVTMHDGSVVRFRRVAEDYDPTDRDAAYAHVRALQQKKEIATGLLYIDGSANDMHAVNRTVDRPLVEIPFEELCPGNAALSELMEEFR